MKLSYAQDDKKILPLYTERLPGTVKIDSNFYYDETEISNFYYLEYIYWNERVFGDSSVEYQSALFDVWDGDTCLTDYVGNYFRQPRFRDYPVVGITQEQARKFCQWRSDRVFELILIRERIIERNPEQNASNYFSIERFFTGDFPLIDSSFLIIDYPQYSLPNKQEWDEAKTYFSQPITKEKKKNLRKKCDRSIKSDSSYLRAGIDPCELDYASEVVTNPVYCDYNDNRGYFILGNVSEWLNEENQYIGGSWRAHEDQDYSVPLTSTAPQNFIGFRCVGHWVRKKD